MSDDWIGATLPLLYSELVHSSGSVDRKLYFVDKVGKEIGSVKISTQYIADGHNSNVISSPHRQSYVSDTRNVISSPHRESYVSDSRHHDGARIISASNYSPERVVHSSGH
jgi:hypothetical protein